MNPARKHKQRREDLVSQQLRVPKASLLPVSIFEAVPGFDRLTINLSCWNVLLRSRTLHDYAHSFERCE